MIRVTMPEEKAIWHERVTFACSPVADCLLGLYLLANNIGSGSAEGSKFFLHLLRQMDQDRERNREIRAFFDVTFPMGTLAFDTVWTLPDARDPAALIAALRALPDTAVVAHALTCGGTVRADAPRSPGLLRSLMDDPAWALEYVQRFVYPAPPDPTRIVDVLTHPARTRERLADLLAGLFASLFAPSLPELFAAGRAAEARMRAVFAADPLGFAVAHLPDAGLNARGMPRVLFWPSAFLGDGWATMTPDHAPNATRDLSISAIAYGADMLLASARPTLAESGAIAPEIAPPETYQDVYRLLADPARWLLIQLLVAAPRYGQELAELLGLSIATISHHLNGLKQLDLVDIRRDEHRLYYHLRTDRLRALLAGAEHGLLMR
ncbi:MAG: metalloregulator ArsR/SmtB family transcription factor [Chloroflexota bacterium]|nr:metalloregulator ArsR/SmtB family transcription factor [Chloroflexota bacterium]